jgi:spore maturation protein CgeB
MTTTYPEVVSKYHRDGISHIFPTQWASRSDQLFPPLLSHQCLYPVSVIGEAHGSRKQRVQSLLDQGIPVSCFGHGWPHGPISADDIPKIMRNSVISLNFANSRGRLNQIKARTFEVPGAGGFLLTEPAPYLESWYVPGREIAVFESDPDLVQKIKFYLSHPDIRDRIAAAGFERTHNDHTYEKRLQSVLNYALHAKDAQSSGDQPAEQRRRSGILYFTSKSVPSKAENLSRLIRWILVWGCSRIWGRERGLRAARRIVFELSWRLAGETTFSQSGWPARMFPEL